MFFFEIRSYFLLEVIFSEVLISALIEDGQQAIVLQSEPRVEEASKHRICETESTEEISTSG